MSGKILVVDDEPLILSTIERALAKKGYDVRITSDAESFLGELAREIPDMLIMDMNLDGLNSESLLDNIEELAPGIQILFISGIIPEKYRGNFLEKPFRLDDLRERVRLMLLAAQANKPREDLP